MSIRHLDPMFAPRSVAVIGASDRPGSVGATVWRRLREGGFAGARWAVNPRPRSIDGEAVHADIASLPGVPELAVICTPAPTVPALVAQLGARGTRAAVVLSAGFDAAQRQALLAAARPHLLRVIGPNGLGLLSPHAGLDASFAPTGAQAGTLAFVSQSGALMAAVLDWAQPRGIGFSHCISLGDQVDVDFADLIDWLASDAHTRAILLYIESLRAARKFMSAARAAARNKPVIAVKAGRSAAGQAAALSHTGALAGSDLVHDAALRRAGVLRVDTLDELFAAAETLAHGLHLPCDADAPRSERLTLLTNGGGAGVLAADAAAQAGIALAPLPDVTRQALAACLPPHWSQANPVDIIGDAPVARYVQALKALLAAPDCGTVLLMHAPTALVPSGEIAAAVLPLAQAAPGRVMGCWLGAASVQGARAAFREAGLPCYERPEQAVRAFSMLADYRRQQLELLETPAPPAAPPGDARVATKGWVDVIDHALAEGRELLSAPEALALLAGAGVPVVATRATPPTAEAAASAAQALGYPVVLKLLSPQITHKSDVGGVALDLGDEAAVRQAAGAMLQRVCQRQPGAVVTGFMVQPLVRRPAALELIVGASIDPLFGPVLLFGQGGTAVERVADRALALPPLNAPLARALVARTRIAALLAGWRDVPPADMDALVAVLLAVSDLLAAEPRIAEIDINPLLADARGVLALDARVRVDRAAPGGVARFAILPYPAELAETWAWQGQALAVRPIRPEDEAQHRAFLEQLDPEDLRLRIFYSRRTLEHSELARLTQIDYGREMAFIATRPAAAGGDETLGVVRATCDPDNESAEFGIIVRSDLKGQGLGRRLMRKLIDYQTARGTRRLVATALAENTRMLRLARALGFTVGEPVAGVCSLTLALPPV